MPSYDLRITLRIPETYYLELERMVALGLFTSVSDAIRTAIYEFAEKEAENFKDNPKFLEYLEKMGERR